MPPGPIPEHRFIAAVRIDVVDDRCRTDHVMTTALDAERMRTQKCHPFSPPPLRAVKRADSRNPLAVMVPVALTLFTPSSRTVDGGSNGHGGDLDDANDGAGNNNAREDHLRRRRATLASIVRIYPIRAVSVRPRNVRRTFIHFKPGLYDDVLISYGPRVVAMLSIGNEIRQRSPFGSQIHESVP